MNPKILLLACAAFLLSACAGSFADHVMNGHVERVDNYNFNIVPLGSNNYDVAPNSLIPISDDIVAFRAAEFKAVENFSSCKVVDAVPVNGPVHNIVKVNCAASNQVGANSPSQ